MCRKGPCVQGQDTQTAITDQRPGEEVTIELVRDGEEMTATVELAERQAR